MFWNKCRFAGEFRIHIYSCYNYQIFQKSHYSVGAAAVRAASRLAEESRGTPVKSTDNKPEKKAATPSEKPSTVSH